MQTLYCIISLLAPIFMLAVGIWWKLSPPKFQGKGLAYRTALTSSSPEAWSFAHHHCAKLWIRIGALLSVLTVILLVLFPNNRADYVLWLIGGQMALFCVSAFLVDILLKNTFHDDGTPISF